MLQRKFVDTARHLGDNRWKMEHLMCVMCVIVSAYALPFFTDTEPEASSNLLDGNWTELQTWSACSVTCGGGTRERSRQCNLSVSVGENCTANYNETESCNEHDCPDYTIYVPIDGVFGEWTKWTTCTLTCGSGTQQRTRTCIGPYDGGKNCQGSFNQTQKCNQHPCPMDGNWTELQTWSACNVTCGGGTRERSRQCNLSVSVGENCTANYNETESCNEHDCPDYTIYVPIDGVFGEWTKWTTCTLTCGSGTQQRTRTCIGPYHGGKNCQGSFNQTHKCNQHPCPMDGNWVELQTWSACSVTCGGGTRERFRQCNLDQNIGHNCTGNYNETESCNDHDCPVDGIFEEWTEWTMCTLTCGSGTLQRTRSCIGPYHGGKNCQGRFQQTHKCNQHPCPIDGYYSEWSEWSTCTLTCGSGNQQRRRTCTPPLYGGKDCQGPSIESQACNTQPCPVDGFWLNWTPWSACDVTCGGGHQRRTRTCQEPQYGGLPCVGVSSEFLRCGDIPCEIDGYYSEWSEWSTCTLTCGSGNQQRRRTCTPPLYGGKDCQGPSIESQACNTQPCPVDGFWLNWTPWSACNVTCGGGYQRRTRTCQEPQYGGHPCVGVSSEFLRCGESSCEIPGNWFPWSSWTLCTVTCGGGYKYRSRECDMNSYNELTAPCLGPAEEKVECHTFNCLPLAHTCTELRERGFTDSVQAEIDPDGPDPASLEPVAVFCDMVSHNGIGVTVIGHDQEERKRVHGYEGPMEYDQRLTYNVSFDHAVAIVDKSGFCEQYISWECLAAIMHNEKDNNRITGFKNRNAEFADYFGGAKPGSQSCACGMNHSCADPTHVCNCDSNDDVWRQDDGLLTYKDDLPVYSFVAGDTAAADEEGYSQVGPLRCHGHASTNRQAP